MMSTWLKDTAKFLAIRIPQIKNIIQDRDKLRAERDALRIKCEALETARSVGQMSQNGGVELCSSDPGSQQGISDRELWNSDVTVFASDKQEKVATMLYLSEILSKYQVPEKYYLLKLDRILESVDSDQKMSPKELFGDVNDNFWLWLYTRGYRLRPTLRKILPGMPDRDIQLQLNGISGDLALIDAFAIYRWVREIYESVSGRPLGQSRVLDFGCGWGRVIRFFLKDLTPDLLWGIDHYDKALDLCKQSNKWCNFQQVDSFPPTSFSENTFDLIYCYSVFSHLSEEAHQKWLREFNRILKPGGVLIATTWERELIVRCAEARMNPVALSVQKHLPTMFRNHKQWLMKYDNGEFCFDSSVESYGELLGFLGEACIPEQYVLKHWSKNFTVVDFIKDRAMCSQNVIVVRKVKSY